MERVTRLKNMSSGDLFSLWESRCRVPARGPGALIASLLEVDLKKSVPAILLGLCMATIIMCFLGYGALGSVLS